MTWRQFFDNLTEEEKDVPMSVAYPDFNSETPIQTPDLEWSSEEKRLEADKDNWNG